MHIFETVCKSSQSSHTIQAQGNTSTHISIPSGSPGHAAHKMVPATVVTFVTEPFHGAPGAVSSCNLCFYRAYVDLLHICVSVCVHARVECANVCVRFFTTKS